MSYISREEFIKRQKERQERAATFTSTGPRVGYLSLKNDGDEAVVRFAYETPDAIYKDILPTHNTTVDGKFRKVHCLRETFKSPISDCPMCATGIPVKERFYCRVIEYTTDENGNIVATPKVWDRPTMLVNELNDFFEEYGNVSDMVFKIKRFGAKGDTQTNYSIKPANQTIYNSTTYPKDLSGFENYDVIGSALLSWDKEEMAKNVGVADTESSPQVVPPRRVTY